LHLVLLLLLLLLLMLLVLVLIRMMYLLGWRGQRLGPFFGVLLLGLLLLLLKVEVSAAAERGAQVLLIQPADSMLAPASLVVCCSGRLCAFDRPCGGLVVRWCGVGALLLLRQQRAVASLVRDASSRQGLSDEAIQVMQLQ